MTNDRAQDEAGTVRYTQFAVDVMQVNFHCAFFDTKLCGDSFIREPLGDEVDDFQFPSRERLTANAVGGPARCLVKHGTLPFGIYAALIGRGASLSG